MIKRENWRSFGYFLRAYPRRGAVMVAALTTAGLLEGVGIMALLPLIALLTGQDGGAAAQGVQAFFNASGLSMTVPHILLFIVAVMVLKAAIGIIAVAQVAFASAHVMADLRLTYIRALMGARWLHYIGLQSGAAANALGMEAQRAAISFKQGCQTLSYLIQIFVYGLLALLVSWQLTAAAVAAGAALVFVLGSLTRAARRAGTEMTDVSNRVLALITDALYGFKPLKAMGKGRNLLRMLEGDVRLLQSAQSRLDLTDQSIPVLAEPLMAVFVALGLWAALAYGGLPLAELLFMAVVFLRMVMRVASAQRTYQSMAANESALWALMRKIAAAAAVQESEAGNGAPSLSRGVDFRNVFFAYDGRPIFNGLTLSLPAHGFTVLYGASGAGKTTLVDLLAGLLQPDAGVVEIDGAPLSALSMEQWRASIGYVPQDVLLFHDTLYNNIALGDASLSPADVESALDQAGALDFARRMERGLDTVVGERGAKLSGGQRQRIAIARALVHKPRLLILDEATSALDPATERDILNTVRSLARHMPVLAISHNPALLDAADHAIRLENGGIAAETPRRRA